MQTKIYQTIKQGEIFEGYYEEKKSKFLAFSSYVASKLEIENFLKSISSIHKKSKHICYAWRLIENGQVFQKSSDDGEPSGTAGKPILNIIEKNELFNVCIVVVRYFGGVKLGAGNLLRAYSKSAKMSIENNFSILQ